VQHPGAIPYERAAPGAASAYALGRLDRPPGSGEAVVAAIVGDPIIGSNRHLLSLPPVVSITAARPASSRATGTRNGEQDT